MSKPTPPVGPPTSIKDIPVCNDRLYKEVANLFGLEVHQVRKLTDAVSQYTVDTMRKGQMEAVMIPYFGKFRPKVKMIKGGIRAQKLRSNGTDILYRVLAGKPIPESQNPENDEAV